MYSAFRKTIAAAVLFACMLSLSSVDGANIAWVTEPRSPTADWDIGWTDRLTAAGHNVTRMNDLTELDQSKIDAMNASDLIIVSRSVNSGNYDDGDEIQQWNGLTAPMISMTAFNVRSNRWKWFDSTTITQNNEMITVVDPSHPIYGGIAAADIADLVSEPNDLLISNLAISDPGNGTLLATFADGNVAGVLFEAGVEYYSGSGETPASPRLYLPFGQANADGFDEWGAFNATAEGEQIFMNAVNFMAVPEPSTLALLGLGFIGWLGFRRR